MMKYIRKCEISLIQEKHSRQRTIDRRWDIVRSYGEAWLSLYGVYQGSMMRHLQRDVPDWLKATDHERELFLSIMSWLLPNAAKAEPIHLREVYNADLIYLGWGWGPHYDPERKITPDYVPLLVRGVEVDRVYQDLIAHSRQLLLGS